MGDMTTPMETTDSPALSPADVFAKIYSELEASKPSTHFHIYSRKDATYFTVHGQNALHVSEHVLQQATPPKQYGERIPLHALNLTSVEQLQTVITQLLATPGNHVTIMYKPTVDSDWTPFADGTSEQPDQLLDVSTAITAIKATTNGTDAAHSSSQSTATTSTSSPASISSAPLDFSQRPRSANSTIAIKASTHLSQRIVGVALCQPDTNELQVIEFYDDNQYSNLVKMFHQITLPATAIVNFLNNKFVSAHDQQRLTDICNAAGVEIKTNAVKFAAPENVEVLQRLIKNTAEHLQTLEQAHAMTALSTLVNFLSLSANANNQSRFTLSLLDLHHYMRLDVAAVDALNLFHNTQTSSEKNSSLHGLLALSRNAATERLLKQWIIQPLIDVQQIERRQDYVEMLVESTPLRVELQAILKSVVDIESNANRLSTERAGLKQVVILWQSLNKLSQLATACNHYDGQHRNTLQTEFITPLRELNDIFQKFQALCDLAIDERAVARGEYLIKKTYNQVLSAVGKRKEDITEQMTEIADNLQRRIKVEIKQMYEQTVGTFCMKVSRTNEKELRRFDEIMPLTTRKDGLRFTTNSYKRLAEQLLDVNREYEKEQRGIVKQVIDVAATFTQPFLSFGALLAEMDVYVSMATASANRRYTRPRVLPLGSGVIRMTKARHPCIEALDSTTEFIANDVDLVSGKSNVAIITGPNMGGKSTYIRQTGLIVLMAQMGMFVPCESAEISVVDAILARVGAGDMQLKGVSTFMKEMLEASSILRGATANSLLVIDELGRGTSTYEGYGLEHAIAEYIASDIKAYALFATHFHELTLLASKQPNVVNLHVDAEVSDKNGQRSIVMKYEVHQGAASRSFGVHVARVAELPAEIIEHADQMANELERVAEEAEKLMAQEPSADGQKQEQEWGMSKEQMDRLAKEMWDEL